MWHPRVLTRPSDDALALEANAATARLALACVYSSAAEYEAELIRVRRLAGAYRARRPWRAMATVATAAMLIAATAAYILPF